MNIVNKYVLLIDNWQDAYIYAGRAHEVYKKMDIVFPIREYNAEVVGNYNANTGF